MTIYFWVGMYLLLLAVLTVVAYGRGLLSERLASWVAGCLLVAWIGAWLCELLLRMPGSGR